MFFWLKLGLVAVLVAAVAWGVHKYNDSLRDQGRAEVQSRWDAAVAKQKTREADAAAAEADRAARERDASDKEFAALRSRNAALASRLAAITVDHDLLTSLLDSVRTSNDEGPGVAAKDTPAPAGPADGAAVAEWFSTVAELYRACREQVIGWVAWDDKRVTQ